MAKKQGVSYGPNASLIQGAATAYRNYDNAAGMYSGLDKVTQAGMGVVDEAVKGYEAEQEKLEKEAKAAQAKADKLNDNWNTLASGVYESAGSFMKDVEYKDTVASVKALRQEYIDAQNSKDAEKMAEVKIKFNNINSEITAHKEFRAKLTHPEYGMSDFVTGDNREYMNGFINEDYVIGRNDKGKKTYTVNGVTKTMEEINKMVDVKNMKPYGDYGKLLNDYSTSKTKGNKNNLLLAIRNSIVPDQENPLRAFLNDKGFGNGQTFSDLLNETGNRASIEKEIMNTAFNGDGGGISDPEYKNFINAIVNPDNEFWKNNGGASAWKNQSRTIATELLANGAENAWDNNPANKPDPVVTDNKESTLKNPERGGFLYGTNSTGFDDSHPDEGKRSRVLNIGFDQQVRNRNALLPKNVAKDSEIQGEHYVYKFNGDTWQAFYNGENIKDVRGSQIAQWEGLLSPLDIQAGNGLPMFDAGTATSKKNKEEEEKKSLEKPLTPGGIGSTSINSSSINDIEKSIQGIFIPQFATDFNISSVYESSYSPFEKGMVSRVVKNKIKITGPSGFEEIYNVGPGSTAETADQITSDILGVSDYRKQVDPDLLVSE